MAVVAIARFAVKVSVATPRDPLACRETPRSPDRQRRSRAPPARDRPDAAGHLRLRGDRRLALLGGDRRMRRAASSSRRGRQQQWCASVCRLLFLACASPQSPNASMSALYLQDAAHRIDHDVRAGGHAPACPARRSSRSRVTLPSTSTSTGIGKGRLPSVFQRASGLAGARLDQIAAVPPNRDRRRRTTGNRCRSSASRSR